jgi:hypothetical protein
MAHGAFICSTLTKNAWRNRQRLRGDQGKGTVPLIGQEMMDGYRVFNGYPSDIVPSHGTQTSVLRHGGLAEPIKVKP